MKLKRTFIKKNLFIFFILAIFTINAKYNDLDFYNFHFIGVFNILRFFFPIILIPVIFYLIYKKIKAIKIDLLLIIFILFGCLQLIFFFNNFNFYFGELNDEKKNILINYQQWGIENLSLIIKFFFLVFLFVLLRYYLFDFKKEIIFIFLIISIYTIYYSFVFLHTLITDDKTIYFYGALIADSYNKFFYQTNPRITGYGRNLCIILAFLFFYLNDIIIKKKISFFFKLTLIFLIFFSVFFLWGTQSRGALIISTITPILFLLFDKKDIKYKILIIFSLSIPIFFFEYIANKKSEGVYVGRILDNRTLSNETVDGTLKIDYSTGRISIWKKSLIIFSQNPWIGHGPQGDRIALLQYDKPDFRSSKDLFFENNSSNAIIYASLSAGVWGSICLVAIYIIIIKKIFVLTFKYHIFKSNHTLPKISATVIIMLLVRSIFENSFSVFSIDLIVLFTLFYYLKNIYSKNTKIENR